VKRVCYYIRVSGAGQIDKDGPERQLDAIRAFSAQHNLATTDNPFFEKGVSGTVEGMDRPEFSRMLESNPSAIVVERMDRLARDLMVQEFLLKECRERGVQVYAADQGVLVDMASDGGDPTRKLIRQVLGALAEWEKSALVLKLKKARDRKREATGRCEGPIPYGTKDSEKAVIRTMLELSKVCDTYQEIADRLNAAGFRTMFGNEWRRSSVFQILAKQAKRMGL
jgi:DNA invertase Pin-like site-specific DNA recombinase